MSNTTRLYTELTEYVEHDRELVNLKPHKPSKYEYIVDKLIGNGYSVRAAHDAAKKLIESYGEEASIYAEDSYPN